MKNLNVFYLLYGIFRRDISANMEVEVSQKDFIPVIRAISYDPGTWRVLAGLKKKRARPRRFRGQEEPGNLRATHRARFPTSRRIVTFPTGYTELIRRPRIPGPQEEDERRSTAIRGRGRWLYVKWIRQRYASSRWIAFPALLTVLFPRSRPRLVPSSVVVFSEQVPTEDPCRLKQVALIASSKSKLIDEFRRRVARK